SRRRHTRSDRDWSSDVCSSDLEVLSERELQRQLQEQRAGYMELVKELQHEKDQRAMLERKASSSITSNPDQLRAPIISLVLTPRSEERRVGKECRSR